MSSLRIHWTRRLPLAAALALLPASLFGQIPYGLGLSCSNSRLTGSYAAQMRIDQYNLLTDLSSSTTPTSSSDAGFGSSSGPASTLALNTTKAKLPGMSRFYFDGNGNIIGAVVTTTTTTGASNLAGSQRTISRLAVAGTYSVSLDCTANFTLTDGTTKLTFFGVVAANGDQVLIQETDSKNPGVTGLLVHGPNFCGTDYNTPQSFAFSYGGVTAGTTPGLYSNVGILTLDGAGNFTVTDSENVNGTITRNGTSKTPVYGTYTIDPQSCVVSLKYTGTQGPAFNILAATGGLGMFTVAQSASQPRVGTFVGVGASANQ